MWEKGIEEPRDKLLKRENIQRGLDKVLSGEHDSAHTVQKLNKPLWYHGEPFNFTRTKMYRNQDIDPMYIDMNLCIYKKEVYTEQKSKYGFFPYLDFCSVYTSFL